MLLGEFVEQVWRPKCERLRECTRVGYESAWRLHINPRWGGTDMADITSDAIEDWLWGFDKPGAARKAWAVLRSILRLAVRIINPRTPHPCTAVNPLSISTDCQPDWVTESLSCDGVGE